MAFTLVVKNSSTSGKLPTIANIQKGELALNLADQKLYSRSTTDEIFEIGRAGETPSGGTDDRPGAPSVGDLYFDTDLNALLYWNGSEWVPVGTEAIAIGDLTDVDTSGVTNGMVLVYDNGEWKPVSPASLAVDVDLGYTADGDNAGTVTNTAGDDATIPVATDTVAGLFTGAEKQKLAGIETGAQVNAQAGRALSYDTGSDPDTLNADIATDAALGVVKIGDGISIDADGEITADIPPGTVISETPPANPEEGQLWWNSSDDSGRLYVYYDEGVGGSAQWVEASPQGDRGIPEAPTDGQQYARQSEAWSVVETFPEAPIDGQQYARQNEAWTVVQGGGGGTTINYNGPAAWGGVNSTGIKGVPGLNYNSTKVSTGLYTVTFEYPMPNAAYAVNVTPVRTGASDYELNAHVESVTATGFNVRIRNASASVDNAFNFSVFASNALPPRGGTGADAWVHANSLGVISASYNIATTASKTSTGVYEYTFTTPMPSAEYGIVATAANFDGTNSFVVTQKNRTTTGFTIQTNTNDSSTPADCSHAVVVHATNAQLPDTITQEQLDAALNSPGVSAWGVIDGTTGNKYGEGLNFTSTKTSTGNYTVTFDSPMPNDAYSVSLAAQAGSGRVASVTTKTAAGFDIRCKNLSDTDTDFTTNFAVHATNAPPPKGGTGADAWAEVGSDASIRGSYNMATCTNTATGTYAFTFTTPMPSDFYSVTANATSGDGNRNITIGARTTAGFTVYIKNFASSNLENGAFQVVVHATNATLPAPLSQDDLLFVDGRNASTGTQEFQDGVSVTGGTSGDGKIWGLDPTEATGGIGLGGDNRILVGNVGKDYAVRAVGENLIKANHAAAIYGTFQSTSHTGNVNAVRGAIKSDTGSTHCSVFSAESSTQTAAGANVYGFYSNIGTDASTNGTPYNFYAASEARNYFAGKIESPAGPSFVSPSDMWTPVVYGNGIGFFYTSGGYNLSLSSNGYRNSSGTWTSLGTNGSTAATSIELFSTDGKIELCVEKNKPTGSGSGITPRFTVDESGGRAANFYLQTEADDPAAYQTTYSLESDDEGNETQVERRTYIGNTIDLLAVITELQAAKASLEARIAALEGA